MKFFNKPPSDAGYVLEESVDGSAIFSKDRAHRYALTRQWAASLLHDSAEEQKRVVIFCGLNPSRAGASTQDQTILKEIGFATRMRSSALIKVNLFSAIETYSARLPGGRHEALPFRELIGPDCAAVLEQVAEIAHRRDVLSKTILCWGSHELVTRERITAVLPYLPGPFECFGTTADGHPRHTSRIAYATPIERWKGVP